MPVNARKLQRRIEIVTYGKVADTFGGFTVAETSRVKRWSEIKDVSSNLNNSSQDLVGARVFDSAYKFTFRYGQNRVITPLVDNIEYKGLKYLIQSVTNENLKDIKTVVYATAINTPNE